MPLIESLKSYLVAKLGTPVKASAKTNVNAQAKKAPLIKEQRVAQLSVYGAKDGSEVGAIDNSIEQVDKNKKRTLPYELKAVFRTRMDIADWSNSLSLAQALYPVNWPLQLLYNEICIDALLTSQIENRVNQSLTAVFNLKNADGSNNDDQTKILKNHPLYRFFIKAIFDKVLRGNRVVELSYVVDATGKLKVEGKNIPCENIVQQTGLFYPDYYDTSRVIKYRELSEYGTYILEFDSGDLGLLNKAAPHVLFKRFAQSCWSELCEIYGIPPRVMKTDTQDSEMLNRATQMMKDMGSAAWFIIDNNESFEWAQGMQTNGDVYKNLIDLCRDEICLLINGAIIGQDTKNGARSKDESSQEMLWQLVQSDMAMIQADFNMMILPALKQLGVISDEVESFEFEPAEDLEQLKAIVLGLLQYYNIDPEWIKLKFGVEVTGERTTAQPNNQQPDDTPNPEDQPPPDDKKKKKSGKLAYKGSKPFFVTARQ